MSRAEVVATVLTVAEVVVLVYSNAARRWLSTRHTRPTETIAQMILQVSLAVLLLWQVHVLHSLIQRGLGQLWAQTAPPRPD